MPHLPDYINWEEELPPIVVTEDTLMMAWRLMYQEERLFMPRNWTPAQQERLQQLASQLALQEFDGVPAADNPVFDSASLAATLMSGMPVICPRLMFGPVPPTDDAMNRGIRHPRGTLWVDHTVHTVWICEGQGWHSLGPDRQWEYQRAEIVDLDDEEDADEPEYEYEPLDDDEWQDFDVFASRRRALRIPIALRRLSPAIRQEREQLRRVRAPEVTPTTDTVLPGYVAIVMGYGNRAQYEILSGPFDTLQMRNEFQSLRGSGLRHRIVIRRLSAMEAESLCEGCFMPRGSDRNEYVHQAHCPNAVPTEVLA